MLFLEQPVMASVRQMDSQLSGQGGTGNTPRSKVAESWWDPCPQPCPQTQKLAIISVSHERHSSIWRQ